MADIILTGPVAVAYIDLLDEAAEYIRSAGDDYVGRVRRYNHAVEEFMIVLCDSLTNSEPPALADQLEASVAQQTAAEVVALRDRHEALVERVAYLEEFAHEQGIGVSKAAGRRRQKASTS